MAIKFYAKVKASGYHPASTYFGIPSDTAAESLDSAMQDVKENTVRRAYWIADEQDQSVLLQRDDFECYTAEDDGYRGGDNHYTGKVYQGPPAPPAPPAIKFYARIKESLNPHTSYFGIPSDTAAEALESAMQEVSEDKAKRFCWIASEQDYSVLLQRDDFECYTAEDDGYRGGDNHYTGKVYQGPPAPPAPPVETPATFAADTALRALLDVFKSATMANDEANKRRLIIIATCLVDHASPDMLRIAQGEVLGFAIDIALRRFTE